MEKRYEAPAVRDLGTVHERTLQFFNKIGGSSDQFANLNLIGSLVPYNP